VIDKRIHATGVMPGRPRKTIHDVEVAKIYLGDVINEVVEAYSWVIDLEDEDFFFALDMLLSIVLANAPSANPRTIAPLMRMSKSTIYSRRRKGRQLQNIFEDVGQIKLMLETQARTDELRWAELFRHVHGIEEDDPQAELDPREANP
jgi:hypothetical protein